MGKYSICESQLEALIASFWADLGSSQTVPVGAKPRQRVRLVYTAFNGDQFCLSSLMRSLASESGRLAVNPESCLGYKVAVDVLKTKAEVLRWDAALVSVCDDFRIFHDRFDGWESLPEGVMVELLWFLATNRNEAPSAVEVISISEAALGLPATTLQTSYSEVAECLSISHPEVVSLVQQFLRTGVPRVAVALYAPRDAKYAHWVRQWMIREGYAPLVPTLAFQPETAEDIGDLVIGWLEALHRSAAVFRLPPLDAKESYFSAALVRHAGGRKPLDIDWLDVEAPKAILGSAWPITSREKRDIGDLNGPRD